MTFSPFIDLKHWSMLVAASWYEDSSRSWNGCKGGGKMKTAKRLGILDDTMQSAGGLQLGRRLFFQQDLKHTANMTQNCVKKITQMFWRGRVRAHTSIQLRICGCILKYPFTNDPCVTWQSLSSFAKKNGGKIVVSRCANLTYQHRHNAVIAAKKGIYYLLTGRAEYLCNHLFYLLYF